MLSMHSLDRFQKEILIKAVSITIKLIVSTQSIQPAFAMNFIIWLNFSRLFQITVANDQKTKNTLLICEEGYDSAAINHEIINHDK